MKKLLWLTLLLTACSTQQDQQRAEAARQDWIDFTCCPPESSAPATPMGEWEGCGDDCYPPQPDAAGHEVPNCCGEDCCGDGCCDPQMCQDLAGQDLPACCGTAGCTCACRPLPRPIDR